MLSRSNRRVFYTFFSALVILFGTLLAIQYAKGNYRVTQNGFSQGTGLLSANSYPTGAQVLIDGKLVTATDDTLYLEPGTYQVKVVKDGFSPWEKSLTIERELVTQTNALLFPSAPSLTPLTFTGVENISTSPDGQKLLFYTASASAQTQNGLYILELGGNLLSFQRGSRQISEDVADWKLNQAQFIWSPDSNEVMLIAEGHQVLLPVDKKSSLPSLVDVGVRAKQILSGWEEEIYLRERQDLAKFPDEIIAYATLSARNVYIAPDKKKLLYTAEVPVTLPTDIVPPLPATNTQLEERTLVANGIYVYDAEEDKNFRVGTEAPLVLPTPSPVVTAKTTQPPITLLPTPTHKYLLATDLAETEPKTLEASPSAFTRLQASNSAQTVQRFKQHYASLYTSAFQWYPDSRHLISAPDGMVKIMDYDSTNNITIYSGTFQEKFVYPWPDGSQLIIMTSFSPKTPPNLYAIELKS